MPGILDRLTTVIEWVVDDKQLKKYESTLSSVDDKQGVAGKSAEIVGKKINRLSKETKGASVEVKEFGSELVFASNKAGSMSQNVGDASDNFGTLGSEIKSTAGLLLKFGGIAAGVATTFGVMSSKELSSNLMRAKSVGMTTDAYLGWEGVLKNIGFEGEKAIDMMEEGTNKIGELSKLGKMSSAEDTFKMLGLSFKEIKDLAPEEQFMQIMEAAKGLSDEQIAQSAVDMIFGGEANRVLGLLRQYDGSVEDIVKKHRDLNVLTDEGIVGNLAFTNSMNNLATAGKSLFQEVIGKAGNTIAPMVNDMLDWVAANDELIRQDIASVVDSITTAFRWAYWAGEKLVGVVGSLGGLANTVELVGAAFAGWKIMKIVDKIGNLSGSLGGLANKTELFNGGVSGLKNLGLAGLFTGAALAVEDLIVYLQDGDSFFDAWTAEKIPGVEHALLSMFGVISDDMSLEEQEEAIGKWHETFLGAVESIDEHIHWLINDIKHIPDFLSGMLDSIFPDWWRKGTTVKDLKDVPDYASMLTKDEIAAAGKSRRAKKPTNFNTLRDVPDYASMLPTGNGSVSQSAAGIYNQRISNSSSTTNQGSSRTEINAPITIHQTQGMSSTDVARAITSELSSQFGDVKTTGIAR
jgi:hypothetical protein